MKVQDSMSSEIKGIPHTIYKINFLNSVYIGSTNDFKHRRSCHIYGCHDPKYTGYNIPLYKHIRKLEEKGDFKFDERCFEIIEVIDDCDEEIIKFYEKWWIEFYKEEKIKMLNKNNPVQTEEEKKEQRKERNKKWNEKPENIEKRKAYNQNPENRERAKRLRRERRAKKKAQAEQKITVFNLYYPL